MKTLKTLEEQRMFLKAVGTVLAEGDFMPVVDSISYSYGAQGLIEHFEIGFDSLTGNRFAIMLLNECEKLGLSGV